MRWVLLGVAVVALAGVVVTLPDIKRYLRIRRM
jgi:hypothetical protein